ncbi:diadenylate cyclase [Paenibacillus sp. FSL K6-1217]|uniref:tetratricopeptide repeat protein n=1 Tax=Paenibacillus sp. FSL K6-1217 TaxID=2921466 RepID=UPI003245414C
MEISKKELSTVNEIIYKNMDLWLKKLNKRIHLKLYALVYDNNEELIKIVRVKKTVPASNGEPGVAQDIFPEVDLQRVFDELRILPAAEGDLPATMEALKGFLDQQCYKPPADYKQKNAEDKEEEVEIKAQPESEDTRLLYANHLRYAGAKNTQVMLSYLLEIRNVDPVSRELFFSRPQFSFLRMSLDYFFGNYFSVNSTGEITLQDNKIQSRFDEDPLLFNRRMSRLFFGKMQEYILSNKSADAPEFNNDLKFDYSIHNLMEQMDEISSLPYENASPFGSILFLHSQAIDLPGLIRFSIRFKETGRILLDDAKRIRKLLELTNEDKDLYLIADHRYIYGLGEVNWNLQHSTLAVRLDFNGLSKLKLVLVHTEAELSKGGELIVENDKRYYRSDLAMVEQQLISLSSKNPRLGEEGYSSERFMKLLENTFWKDQSTAAHQSSIEALDLIVRKAREQKHGTMVVITSPDTAKQELITLSKQSTPIEEKAIHPDHVKFLTAIDGAIYFDTQARCHALGVILDGNAKPDIGDPSRGARFNSAHRYLHKLKDSGEQECVIAIISEDGMVNLIPENENEDLLLATAEEMIDLINVDPPDLNKLEAKGKLLLESSIVDSEWLFKVGRACWDKKMYDRAIQFVSHAETQAKSEFITASQYNLIGNCFHNKAVSQKVEPYDEQDIIKLYEKAIAMYEKAIENSLSSENWNHIYNSNLGNSCSYLFPILKKDNNSLTYFHAILDKAIHSLSEAIEERKRRSLKNNKKLYFKRAYCLQGQAETEENEANKEVLYRKSMDDYNLSLELEPKDTDSLWNKSLIHEYFNELNDAVECLARALVNKNEEKFMKKLVKFINKQPDLILVARAAYTAQTGSASLPPELDELYEAYLGKLEAFDLEGVAAAKEMLSHPKPDSDEELDSN